MTQQYKPINPKTAIKLELVCALIFLLAVLAMMNGCAEQEQLPPIEAGNCLGVSCNV